MNVRRTTEDWEAVLGDNVRRARINAELTMRDVAERSGVSMGALHNLENGRGATLKTLIRVVRALERTDWLDALEPQIGVSPMQALRDQQRLEQRARRRVRRPT